MTFEIGVTIGADTSVATAASDDAWEATVTSATADLTGRDDFIGRVGDPVDMIDDDGAPVVAADLYAVSVERMVAAVEAETEGIDDARVAIAYPDTWPAEALAEVRTALGGRGRLADVTWVSHAAASTAAAEHTHGAFPDDSIVVAYDLGASSLTVSLVRAGDVPEVIGRPLSSSAISGREFDRLILADVLAVTGAADAAGTLDPSVIDDLVRLRAACRAAKEQLSADTEAVVDVAVGKERTQARVVREDVENLLRGPILESVALVREALLAADVDLQAVTAVVASGGGSSIPLVTELLSTSLHLPVVPDPDPAAAPAVGAALLLSRLAPRPANADIAALPAQPPLREIIPAPSVPVADPPARVTRRRGILIAAGTGVLAVITAAGLSVGTGLLGSSDPAVPAPADAATSGPLSPGRSTPAGTTGAGHSTRGPAGTTTAADVAAEATRRGPARPAPTDAAAPGTSPTPSPNAPGSAPGTTQNTAGPTATVPPAPNPGTQTPSPSNPPPEFPEDSSGNPNTGGGGNSGGGIGSGVTQLPGRIVDGTGETVCGVAGVLCR